MGPLGCIIPKDKPHVTEKPLAAAPAGFPTDVPVVVGFPWYDSFDEPKVIDGSYHLPDVSKGEDLGTVRGGHCFCFEPMGAVRRNRAAAQVFYNQGEEGACVGFGNSRAITITRLEELFFDAFWLYDEARRLEGTYPSGEGATVHAGAQILLSKGHRVQAGEEVCTREEGDDAPNLIDGISAIRWATSIQEVLKALGREGADAVPFENSWGLAYPGDGQSVCWMPTATFDQLLREGGEAGVYTER